MSNPKPGTNFGFSRRTPCPRGSRAKFWPIVVVLVCAGASFFFALAETALFSLSKWQVRELTQRAGRAGGVATRLLAEPQDLLATMVLGNTFANAGMLAVGLWLALGDRGPLAGTVATVAAVFLLTLFFGEVLPKTLSGAPPGSLVVARGAGGWRGCIGWRDRSPAQRLITPCCEAIPESVKPQQMLTDADYQELVEFAFQQGNLARSARDIILQIVRSGSAHGT